MNDSLHVVVIGGGGTGAAIALDLVKRGFTVDLFERGELTSGTTGRHHGQLHSGARYAVGDREIARECMEETTILRRIAPQSIQSNYGLFITLTEEDEAFEPTFLEACEESGIPTRRISGDEARRLEPRISPEVRKAVVVPDGTLDAWRLPLQFFATARRMGARIHAFTPVVEIIRRNGAVTGVVVEELPDRRSRKVEADFVVSATGAWASEVAAVGGVHIPVTPAPGTMVAVRGRPANMVISHLHEAGDGDIIVPQRGLSIIGSTQWITDRPDEAATPDEDIDFLLGHADRLISGFSGLPFHAAWTAVRPLSGEAHENTRRLSRDFDCIDHEVTDGVSGLVSVTGGKATVLRAMAETTVDLICRKVGVDAQCTTADEPLLSHRAYFTP
ncbi:MAG: FAD-dependent oxidoreductase [Spirochaetota bacterium]